MGELPLCSLSEQNLWIVKWIGTNQSDAICDAHANNK